MPTRAPDPSVPVSYIPLYPSVSGGDRVGALSRIDGALIPVIAENIEYLYRAINPALVQKMRDDISGLLARVAALELVAPTSDQKAALLGYPGGSAPNLSNKYLTEAFIPLISSSWSIPTPLYISPQGVDAGEGGEFGARELAINGMNFTSFLAPDSLVADLRYILPSTAPATGAALVYDPTISGYPGKYPLRWSNPSAGLLTPLIVPPQGTLAGAGGQVELKELAANGTSVLGLVAPDSLPADVHLVFPPTPPSAGMVLGFDPYNISYPTGYYPLAWTSGGSGGTKEVLAGNGTTTYMMVMGLGANDLVFLDGILDPGATAYNLTLTVSYIPNSSVIIIHGLTISSTPPVFGASGPSHSIGSVPDPGAVAGILRFLREDATFVEPPASSVFVGSGASHAIGLVPDPGVTPGTTKYLREDSSFQVPPVTPPWTPTLAVLHETVFSALSHGYLDGDDYANYNALGDGISYEIYRSNAGGTHTINIDGSGLTLTGNASSTRQWLRINPGGAASGSIFDLVTPTRFRRGAWGIWQYRSSYDFTYATSFAECHLAVGVRGGTYGGLYSSAPYLFGAVRAKNLWAAPNNAAGGLSFGRQFGNGTVSYQTIGASALNVTLLYVRNPYRIDVYYGTWASGWPVMEDMLWAGTIDMAGGFYAMEATSGNYIADLSAWAVYFELNAAITGGQTINTVLDRWRLTTWE